MNKFVVIVGTVSVLVAPSITLADDSPCISNFTSQGSFFAGKQFKTWQDLAGVAKLDAYSRIYAALVKEGWRIGQADKDAGVIAASQEVSYGNGKAAPLNIIVEDAGAGVKVSATYSISGGVSAKVKDVQKSLCSYLAAAEKKGQAS